MSQLDYFVRELEVNLASNQTCTLRLHQKSIGDVNCIVWDAALVLAKYLEYQQTKCPKYLQHKNVLELGAGVGCVGLTAAVLGANVILTDLLEALPITNDNIAFNQNEINATQGTATAQELRWGEKLDDSMKNVNFVVLSDCVYYEESIKPLIHTLSELSNKDVQIIQCQEIRDTEKQKAVWNLYMKSVQDEFKIIEVDDEDLHPDFRCSTIKLLKLYKK